VFLTARGDCIPVIKPSQQGSPTASLHNSNSKIQTKIMSKDKLYTAEEAVRAIEKLILATHYVKWTGLPEGGLAYDGPELTHHSVTACCVPISESITEWSFNNCLDQNGTQLQHLLMKVYQLGFNRCAENH
jgi:hypothetical protein